MIKNYGKELSYNISQRNYKMKTTNTTAVAETMMEPFRIHNTHAYLYNYSQVILLHTLVYKKSSEL